MIYILQGTATNEVGTSYFYLVYDVFDGTHRTTGMKLNVERKVGSWSPKTTVPVAVHNQDLLDAIAIRFAGLCNELQVVAKSSSYNTPTRWSFCTRSFLPWQKVRQLKFQRPGPHRPRLHPRQWPSSKHPGEGNLNQRPK